MVRRFGHSGTSNPFTARVRMPRFVLRRTAAVPVAVVRSSVVSRALSPLPQATEAFSAWKPRRYARLVDRKTDHEPGREGNRALECRRVVS